MKQITISAIILILFSFVGFSQIKVDDNNRVSIGEDEPVSKFAINGPGLSQITVYMENDNSVSSSRTLQVVNSNTTSSWGYSLISSAPVSTSAADKTVGLKSSAISSTQLTSKRSYGIWGQAGNATSGYNYGVYGELYGSNNGAAIFAIIPGKSDINVAGKWAGYFRGNVKVEDTITYGILSQISDINLKKDIRPLSVESTKQMDKIKNLTPIIYKLKNPGELYVYSPEVSDTLNVDPRSIEYTSDLYTKDQIGLSAQEVQSIYPELVNKSADGYLSMNYIGLIPVLIEALKEQDAEIELLRKEIEGLKSAK